MSPEVQSTIRKTILQIGTSYPSYGESIPSNWLYLHTSLCKLKENNIPVISLTELKGLNGKLDTPLEEKELELFLDFYTSLGYLLYFKDSTLSHMLILDVRILIEAMQAFITREQRPVMKRLSFFRKEPIAKGQIKKEEVLKVWEKSTNAAYIQNHQHLLSSMEKLDLICHQKTYDSSGFDEETNIFFVPCMLNERAPRQSMQYSPTKANQKVTMTFSFKKSLLPPAIYHRVVCSCITKWPIVDSRVYCDLVVMKLSRKVCLELHRTTDAIEVSFYGHSSLQDPTTCIRVKDDICETIKRIVPAAKTSSLQSTTGNTQGELFEIVYDNSGMMKAIEKQEQAVAGVLLLCHVS